MSDISISQRERHAALLDAFIEYLPLTLKVQQEFSDITHELADQEGFSREVCEGIEDWISGDLGTSWRSLRRARFDPDKAQSQLLDTLTARIQHSLHGPIPHLPPYNDPSIHRSISAPPPLFTFLPPTACTDLLNCPIAVLTLEQVRRNGDGTLDGLKELGWWTAEMGRRVVTEWYGTGGEGWVERGRRREKRGMKGKERVSETETRLGGGYVLLVDAKGAGFKNLEFELLPTLINIHHNHFPGLVESVFIVNYTWAHAGLWAGLKRVLPSAALEKIVFLSGELQTSQVFDLDTLPVAYGGRAAYDIATAPDTVLRRFSALPPSSRSASRDSISSSPGYTRSASVESIADIFYSSNPTPSHSTPASPKLGGGRVAPGGGAGRRIDLRMTKAQSRPVGLNALGLEPNGSRKLSINIPRPPLSPSLHATQSRTPSPSPSPSGFQTPLERIKSLADFRLYLNPSQQEHIDLLLGSDDEDDPPRRPTIVERRKQQRPSISPVAVRTRREMILGMKPEGARSYSASLTRHHRKVLSDSHLGSSSDQAPSPISHTTSDPPPGAEPIPVPSTFTPPPAEQPIGAYDTSNPMFGYPAVRSSSALKPRYGRKRKRDLAKTLVFLFLLRLVSLREWLEVFFASFRVGGWSLFSGPSSSRGKGNKKRTPETAFTSSSVSKREGVDSSVDRNIVWLALLMLVIRGTLPEGLGVEGLVVRGWEGWERVKGVLR